MHLNVFRLPVLFSLFLLVQNAVAQECHAKNSINFNRNHFNFRLNGYVIQNKTVPAVADCARECFRLTKCLSFNMATSIGLCQLNSVNSSTNLTSNLKADNKFNYFDLSVFPETTAGPCGKKPCLMNQMCLPSNGKHTCANVECSPYIAPTNGKVKPTTAVIADRNVTVSCRAGFSIVGDSLLTCQFDGYWTGVSPKCKRDCPPAVAPQNGQVSAPNSYKGETATYTCLDGYSLIGSETATCAKGAWSPSAPLCKQARDCYDVLNFGIGSNSGIYTVYLQNNKPHDVYCDMVTDGGGWTVFQYRHNGSVDFYRTFLEYENGFGDVRGEFWMGLKYIHEMTDTKTDEIYLQFVDSYGNIAMEQFSDFYISAGADYTLHVGGLLKQNDTTPNKSLLYNRGSRFTAKDVYDKKRCAYYQHSAWWYNSCGYINPNGEYATPGRKSSYDHGWGGMINYGWKGHASLKSTKLMFRRI